MFEKLIGSLYKLFDNFSYTEKTTAKQVAQPTETAIPKGREFTDANLNSDNSAAKPK